MLILLFGVLACFIVFAYVCGFFVESVGAICRRLRIPPSIAGATFAAIGTSMPEFGTSLFAVMGSHPNIGVGTIIGSAIFNITVIIAASAMIRKCDIFHRVYYRDGIFYVIAVLETMFFISDGAIALSEALIWVATYAAYLFVLVADIRLHKEKGVEKMKERPMKRAVPILLLSLVTIMAASHFLVGFTVELAQIWGVSDAFISLILIAAGTSVPDLLTSVIAARRGMGSFAVSNAIGSNSFDILICLGVPLSLGGTAIIEPEVPLATVFLFISLAVGMVLIREKWYASKREGIILLLIYAAFIISLFMGII